MPQYIKCQYINCGAIILQRSPKQKYCNLTCCNRAQYLKYKLRSQGVATPPPGPGAPVIESRTILAAQEADQIDAEARRAAREAESASALAFLGITPSTAADTPEPDINAPEPDVPVDAPVGTASGMQRGSTVWTRAQLEEYNRKLTEEKLIALDKANRAQRKRQHAIERALKIAQDEPDSVRKILNIAKDDEI